MQNDITYTLLTEYVSHVKSLGSVDYDNEYNVFIWLNVPKEGDQIIASKKYILNNLKKNKFVSLGITAAMQP